MNIVDKIITTLETFCERQHDEVLDCIPAGERVRPSNWLEDLEEQAGIYQEYMTTLENLRRSRNLHMISHRLLLMILEEIEELG